MGVTEDGTDWSMDIDNITEMCSQIDNNLAFIMCTGDLAHAMPVDEGQNNAGSLPALRPAQVRFSKRFLPLKFSSRKIFQFFPTLKKNIPNSHELEYTA